MKKLQITEEMGVHEKWMARAKEMRVDDLPEFIRELTQDYEHDYGTICHAIAAAAIAAAWAVEREPCGGITGFQAGAVGWKILKGWGSPTIGETGTQMTNYDNLLFPQYEEYFTTISQTVWTAVQKLAREKFDKHNDADARVRAHWKSIMAGVVPFGLRVIEDD